MAVYILSADVNQYQCLSLVDEGDLEVLSGFDGRSLSGSWLPLRLRLADEEKGKPSSDTPGLLSHVPLFSRRAVEALGNLLVDNGELLELECDLGEYFAFNITTVVDALDESRSDVIRFKQSGRIMRINKHVFREDMLGRSAVFKIPQRLLGYPYVTSRFVSTAERAGLVGFEFRQVT